MIVNNSGPLCKTVKNILNGVTRVASICLKVSVVLSLLIKTIIYYIASIFNNLPGRQFDTFGRRLGINSLIKTGKINNIIFNPVSCVRYFEFNYVVNSIECVPDCKKVLDVASPYLFGFFISQKYNIDYIYVNPDAREFNDINHFIRFTNIKGKYTSVVEDATRLPYQDNEFDVVLSISVIEHINGNNDSKAMQEMWRVLKPDGYLILTFPVKKQFEDEYRDNDVYMLNVNTNKEGGYFFQRYYNSETINARLLSHISNYVVDSICIYGEIQKGFFEEYEKRWIKNGLHETVKDPFYMSYKMQYFNSISELNGMAVLGITLHKIC